MRKIAEIDEKIIDRLQEAYLWLFDRTGVYVATTSMVLIIMWFVVGNLRSPDYMWLTLLGLVACIICGLAQISRYRLQDRAQYEKFNAIALLSRQDDIRISFQSILAVFAALDALNLDVLSFIRDMCLIIYFMTFAIMIRERDKKPFFETKQEQEMVFDGAN